MATPNKDLDPVIKSEFSLMGLIRIIWIGRWVILLLCLIGSISAGIYAWQMPSVFTAQVTMLPQKQAGSGGLLGQIAAFTGRVTTDGGTYETLYHEIIHSDRIIDMLLERTWDSEKLGKPSSLFKIFHLNEPTDDSQESRIATFRMKQLLRNKIITFHRSKLNGYMKLKVNIPEDAALASEMANFLVDRLDEYNRRFMVGKAGLQLDFIGSRLSSVELELAQAESALTEFLQTNRGYSSSPMLLQQHGELKREALALTSIWSELRRQLELARIEAQKESISVDILDRASIPVRPSSPNRLQIVCFGAFLGFMLGCLGSVVRQQWPSLRP